MATRVRRSKEERIAELDRKVQNHQEAIASLTARKEAILHPKPRISKAQRIKAIIEQAKGSGMSLQEIAERLGLPPE